MASIPAFRLSKNDRFTFQGLLYIAIGEPTGEFSTYINVKDEKGREGEIYLPSGSYVEKED